MRALTCIIVDDEPLAVRLLESYVEKTPHLELLASFTDSITAINAIKVQKPDLLFLDIQMPNIDGMELAHSLPEATRVVFTTAFKEYAFESYDLVTIIRSHPTEFPAWHSSEVAALYTPKVFENKKNSSAYWL